MMVSPFTFYRGAAAIMAADLSCTPSTGLTLVADGDCHLLNFGGFATAERKLIFDINDFDEVSFAPWEWDIKRLVASFVIAGHDAGSVRDGVTVRRVRYAAPEHERYAYTGAMQTALRTPAGWRAMAGL